MKIFNIFEIFEILGKKIEILTFIENQILSMFHRLSPLWGKIGLFGGD
jgi:hypothetical protein